MQHGSIHLVETTDPNEARVIQRRASQGQLLRIGDGVYVESDVESVEDAVYQASAQILAKFAPGAVLYGVSGKRGSPLRSAGEDGRPVYPGWLFATHTNGSSKKRISLPGLEIRSAPGAGALPGDTPFLGIHLPSLPRKLLENLKPSRERDGPAKTLGQVYVEEEMDRILKNDGEAGLERILAAARAIVEPLDAEKEMRILEGIALALRSQGDLKLRSEGIAARRRAADPYDLSCLDTLRGLAIAVQDANLPRIDDVHVGKDRRECVSFIEAYFSNYIEGTKFLVDKARRIVFLDEDADGRYKDGRDVVQTYRQVVSLLRQTSSIEAGEVMANQFEEFLDEIQERHAHLMGARPEVRPGSFKEETNMAGNHVFVRPELVKGTLREGFAMMQGIDRGAARGLFVHALSVLVHPFDDGNGRISRILMTKEIVGNGETRIIVPTLARNDYIGAMRALTRPDGSAPGPYVRALSGFQRLAASISEDSVVETIRQWGGANAFLEDERGAQLLVPSVDREVECRDGVYASKAYFAELALARERGAGGFSI